MRATADDNYMNYPDDEYNIDSNVESQNYEDNFVDEQFTSKENGGESAKVDQNESN
jgi:hypothetical protein